MGVTIFLALNVVAVMFLLYALAHFWRDGQSRNRRDDAMSQQYAERERANVTVVTRQVYSRPRRSSVIRFSTGNAGSHRKFGGASSPAGDMEWPATRISTR
jgi:hypothetical protein